MKPPFLFPPFRPPKRARQRACRGEGGHAFCFSWRTPSLHEAALPSVGTLYTLSRFSLPKPVPSAPPPTPPPTPPAPPLPPPSTPAYPLYPPPALPPTPSLPLIPAAVGNKIQNTKSRLDETFISARSHPKPETLNPNPKPRTAKELVL